MASSAKRLVTVVVGLNPPFGHMNKEARRFVEHALEFRPRLLCLIMPHTNWRPAGYTMLHFDAEICKRAAFYVPGTTPRPRRARRRKARAPPPCCRHPAVDPGGGARVAWLDTN